MTVNNDNLPAAQQGVGNALGQMQAVGGDIAGKVEVKNGGNAGLIQATAAAGAGGRITSAQMNIGGDAQWVWGEQIVAPVSVGGRGAAGTRDEVSGRAAGSHGSLRFDVGGYVWDPRSGWRRLNPRETAYVHALAP